MINVKILVRGTVNLNSVKGFISLERLNIEINTHTLSGLKDG